MSVYDFTAIEAKWQKYWADNNTFVQPNPGQTGFDPSRPKYYVLDMFPYPSGAGLHVGHPEGYTATDIVSRYKRMRGFNVLHPMGYDAFGLPAQQYAVEHGIHPRVTTERNIANIERQIKMFGFSYDWSRRVATTDADYYRWTQWIFLRLYESWYDPAARAARPIAELERKLESGKYLITPSGDITANVTDGLSSVLGEPVGLLKWAELPVEQRREILDGQRLAYLAEVPVNWCPKLGTVLANEEVTNEGKSERGDHPVYRRAMKQWMLRITAYADRLLADIDGVDWPEPIKIMQRNWIGRSEGAEVDFDVADTENTITVYTTRPDTLFGATYMVLAPEHPLVEQITTPGQREAVRAYVEQSARKSELERAADTKEKTGVFTGAYAINPVYGEENPQARIPIWIADYVMMSYGTGAIMAVPAHDTRDYEFAQKFNLPVIQVVQPLGGVDWHGFTDDGVAINSGKFDGLPTAEFKKKITAWLEEEGIGNGAVNYKLRDWIFSRQWYWGEPFPIIHCEKCGVVAVPDGQLPVLLPDMPDFAPEASDDPTAPPKPPLGRAKKWAAVACPQCGGPATRELNAMPQWAGSCWYYLRYQDAKNDKQFVDPKIEKYWMNARSLPLAASRDRKGADADASNETSGSVKGGVDLYVGGAEHAVLHLLYARFWHKVLFDLGYVSTAEPFHKLFNQGMIRSFAYRDKRGVYIGYGDIDFREDGAYHKATGEKLAESVEKMSKSLKNVVNPDEVIGQYGADTFRLYEMFMGPLDASKPWNTNDVPGVHRFLHRVWRMVLGSEDQKPLLNDNAPADVEKGLHKLIKKVAADIEAMKFNTAIAAMMEFVNAVYKVGAISKSQAERFVLVLAPFGPHVAEELWASLGHDKSLTREPWPAYDEAMLAEDTVELVVQVNGKMRGKISVSTGVSNEDILKLAAADPKVAGAIEGKALLKKIVVPGRLVNFVVK